MMIPLIDDMLSIGRILQSFIFPTEATATASLRVEIGNAGIKLTGSRRGSLSV